MNWMCDVYVYESCEGGWITHVASRRRVIPPIPDIPIMRVPRFGAKYDPATRETTHPSRRHDCARSLALRLWAFWRRWVHMASMNLIPLRPIGLAHDGESFSSDVPGDCADLLLMLRAAGYNVPQGAIDTLREEQTELDKETAHA